MKKLILSTFFLLLVAAAWSQGFYKLVWYDEFSGTGAPDASKWAFQLGTGEGGLKGSGWGNNELQNYRSENATQEGGRLVIKAKKETCTVNGDTRYYSSARLTTRGAIGAPLPGLFSNTYGRFEARISLPPVEGMWPAFWLLPQASPYGGWASSGEIDIMEVRGRLPNVAAGTVHYGGGWPDNKYTSIGDKAYPAGTGNCENYHTYAIEWTPQLMSWFFDGRLVGTVGSWYSAQGGAMPKPFDVPFHMIMNLAIGGDFDGGRKPPETWTESEMKVDWVRVWEWDNNLTTRQLPPSSEISTPVDDTGSTYPAGSDGGNNGPHGVPGSSGGEGGGTSANLCLNKPATASSFEPNSTLGAIEAKYAVDGNTTGTRWGSVEDGNPNTQEWLKIDLEKVEELKEIKIFWEAANAKEYKVSLSADDATYTEVFHETAGSENVNYDKTIDVTGKSARYIKIDCLVKNPAWQGNYYGYSIWEVEAYGPASAIVAPESGRWQVIQNSGSLTVPQAQSLKIYSLSGKLLAKATGNSLPIASLQGVYVLKAMKNNTEQSMKVIIK